MAKMLVCRCEDVTLHELEDAVARGHDDIESLKRYTGFGTGWCQGKGCVALCARLLVERGGNATIPFTPATAVPPAAPRRSRGPRRGHRERRRRRPQAALSPSVLSAHLRSAAKRPGRYARNGLRNRP